MDSTQEKLLDSRDLGSCWLGGRFWRRGITTGTCATAASKAAAEYLLNERKTTEVIVTLPKGERLIVPIHNLEKKGNKAICTVIKDGGDDPDITHGLPIVAEVSLQAESNIIILGGPGVGQVTKPGLAISPGEAAINPVPRAMIRNNLAQLLKKGQGAIVSISVPGGEEVAEQTMNPQLGILGGISILGTGGIVEPMSEEAFKNSLLVRVQQIKNQGNNTLILVPGKMGERAALEVYALPPKLIAQISNFAGFMLEQAAKEGFQKILIIGHIGKTVKLAAGIFHTHNRVADGRLETIAAHLALLGAQPKLLKRVMEQVTTEGALSIIREAGLTEVFGVLAEKGEERCQKYLRGQKLEIGLVLTDLKGNPLGMGKTAWKIGGELNWSIKSR